MEMKKSEPIAKQYVYDILAGTELYHHGILGMHWGVRRYQPYPSGYSGEGKYVGKDEIKAIKKTQKMAQKDAKKYVDAKMYYGQGAGVRRRHLKDDIVKKQKDPVYKEAFDKAVENANYASSVRKAKTERRARDTAETVKNVAIRYGTPALSIAAYAYYASHKQQVDNFVARQVDIAATTVDSIIKRRQAAQFLKRMGL